MVKNEMFKVCYRAKNSLWSWVPGRGAVRYSDDYWTKPTCERWKGQGDRLSVFRSYRTAERFVWPWGERWEIWRCIYRGKPQTEKGNPRGTLRVTSVKLIEQV